MSKKLIYIKKFWNWLIECVFPAFCLGCSREGPFLCEPCLQNIPRQSIQICPLCYTENRSGMVCRECLQPDFYLDGVISATKFEEKSLLQRCIHTMKYDFVEALAEPLGKILYQTIEPYWRENWTFCPVALHPKRFRWRGFNQAEKLVFTLMAAAQKEGITPKIIFSLQRVTFGKPQMELKRDERLKNIKNAFTANNTMFAQIAANAHTVILVDDVATTLATLNAAAKALKEAGAKRVIGLVLARVY